MSTALTPLANADPKIILQRYLSDESTKDIAGSYGVTRQALGQFLLRTAEQDWKDAQVARAIARKEAAQDTLDKMGEQIRTADREGREMLTLSLAHVKEQLKSAQWDLERVCRRIYGQDAPPAGAGAVQININLRGDRATNAVQHEIVDVVEQDKQT